MELFLGILGCFSSPAFSQYSFDSGLRPDVTFGEHNDRFDVSPLIDEQNRYFRTDDSIDYRRRHDSNKAIIKKLKNLRTKTNTDKQEAWKWNGLMSSKRKKKLAKKIREETDRKINNVANQILLRITNARRKVEDDLGSGDGNNLGKSRTGTRRLGTRAEQKNIGLRRIGETELFNYAFPIDMNVEGYLVAPER